MKLTAHRSSIKTIRQGDPNFEITDGLVISPRAGFEINQRCPVEYRQMLMTALDLGWIKPVAHIHDHELMWDVLAK